ncbi:MAG: ABATE domain-containing protein [Alphaproteobacteria bacterium]|nr:ABATE domain-containing protein [Alphaproteobacteria bacterium]MCW5738972.1 ABATE domain-containing protein [Alphaproteobacteria bacterium]
MSEALVPAAKPDLCLEFVNTRFWRGSEPSTETLNAPEDLLAWCAANRAHLPETVATVAKHWRAHPEEAAQALRQSVAIREAIHGAFAEVAAGRQPGAAALAPLNQALAQAPGRTALQPSEHGLAWTLPRMQSSVPALLASVLWSAGDLMMSGKLDRVRRCANDKCQWLFLDDSRGGTRRWCTMSSCGNRAKAHRHYAKKKKSEG